MCSKNYWWSDRFARRFAKETPEIALPLEGGIDRIYPVGKIEVVSKK